jgi:hypothetical protein
MCAILKTAIIVKLCTVAYRSVLKQWLCKQRPLLDIARNNSVMQPVSKHRLSKHDPAETNTRATIEERCFLLGPPRGYIARTPGRQSEVQLSEVKWSSWLVSERVQLRVGSWVERALQGRLRRYAAVVELTRFQLRYFLRTAMTWARQAEESPLLEAVARERLLKTQ